MRCDAGTIPRSVPASHVRPPFLTSARPIFSNNKESARQPLFPGSIPSLYSIPIQPQRTSMHTASHSSNTLPSPARALTHAHAAFLHPPSLPPTAAASIHSLDRVEGAEQWIASSSSQTDRPATCAPACLCTTSHPIAEPRAVHADPLYCVASCSLRAQAFA